MSRILIDENGDECGIGGYGLQEYEQCEEVLCLKTAEQRLRNYLSSETECFKKLAGFGCAMAFNRRIAKRWGLLWSETDGERYAQDPTWELRALLSMPAIGSKAIACRYRSHSGNLLNRSLSSTDAADWWRNHELFMSRYHRFDAASHRRMLRDLDLADCWPGLSDWTPEQRCVLREELQRQLATREMCSDWWSISWFSRVCRTLRYRKCISPHFRRWPWWRLLPLSLFCLLKAHRK